MVSFPYRLAGFRLEYKKERESLYLLHVPLYKALALPINVERATRSLTPYDEDMTFTCHDHCYHTVGAYRCLIPDIDLRSC